MKMVISLGKRVVKFLRVLAPEELIAETISMAHTVTGDEANYYIGIKLIWLLRIILTGGLHERHPLLLPVQWLWGATVASLAPAQQNTE